MWIQEGRVTVDQIWVTRQVMEKAVEYRTPVHLCFIDLTKAYDSVDRAAMVAILKSYGVPQQLVEIIEDLYAGTWCHVRTTDGTSQDFEVKTGVRQGCVLSPIVFNCFLNRILKEVAGTLGGGLQVEYTTAGGLFLTYRDQTEAATLIQDVLYVDDRTMIAESRSELQHMLNVLNGACSLWGMTINEEKTKVLTVGDPPPSWEQQTRHLSPSRTVHWRM